MLDGQHVQNDQSNNNYCTTQCNKKRNKKTPHILNVAHFFYTETVTVNTYKYCFI